MEVRCFEGLFQPMHLLVIFGLPSWYSAAALIIGYGHGINSSSFRVDDERGMIVAPASIGQLNHFTVLVFARNGAEVDWKQIELLHAPAAGVQ